MAPTPAAYVSYTAAINPENASPALTRAQIWAGLQIKVGEAQAFVPTAILSTDVIERKHDAHGRPVVVREVVFRDGNRRVREEVTLYEPNKVVFKQTDGSYVSNIISDSATGQLYMTYDFEWLLPGFDAAVLAEKTEFYKKLAAEGVESSIAALREMVKNGRITA